jgi:thioredoxin
MKLNEADFRTLLDNEHDPVVAVFSATWCGPCKSFAPIIEEASKKLPGVNICKLDIDEADQICEDLGIKVVPTVVVFKSSKAAAMHEGGFTNASHLVDWLNSQGVKGKK